MKEKYRTTELDGVPSTLGDDPQVYFVYLKYVFIMGGRGQGPAADALQTHTCCVSKTVTLVGAAPGLAGAGMGGGDRAI